MEGILWSRLGGGNGMEWKGMKRIILKYSSLPSFGSFRLRLGVHKIMEWNDHKGLKINGMECI